MGSISAKRFGPSSAGRTTFKIASTISGSSLVTSLTPGCTITGAFSGISKRMSSAPRHLSYVSPLAAARATDSLYRDCVNPEWAHLLNVLQMDASYDRCIGAELYTSEGRRILDFLSGYCVHNVGHNHPAVIAAVREELESCGPAMIQTHVAARAGELGERLCRRAGGRLPKAFFASAGSEGIGRARR